MANGDVDKAKAEASNLAASTAKLNKEIEAMSADVEGIRKKMKANAKLKDELRKLLKKA